VCRKAATNLVVQNLPMLATEHYITWPYIEC
jgi:hypothetical protein